MLVQIASTLIPLSTKIANRILFSYYRKNKGLINRLEMSIMMRKRKRMVVVVLRMVLVTHKEEASKVGDEPQALLIYQVWCFSLTRIILTIDFIEQYVEPGDDDIEDIIVYFVKGESMANVKCGLNDGLDWAI